MIATDFEKCLDDSLRDLDSKRVEQVRTDCIAFGLVYFRWDDDPARETKLLEWLAKHWRSVADGFMPEADASDGSRRRIRRRGFAGGGN